MNEIWRRVRHRPVELEIKERKWRNIGHVLRQPQEALTRNCVDGTPKGREERKVSKDMKKYCPGAAVERREDQAKLEVKQMAQMN